MVLANDWFERFDAQIKGVTRACSVCGGKDFNIRTSPVALLNVPDGVNVQERGSLSGVVTCGSCGAQTQYCLETLGLSKES